MSNLLGIQEKNDLDTKSFVEPTFIQRDQSQVALAPAIATISFIPHIISTLQLPTRVPVQLPQIPFIILPTIQLHLRYKPKPFNPTNHCIPFTTAPDNIPCSQHPNNPAKNRAQCTATSTNTTPKNLTAKQQLPNLRNHPHNRGRLQLELPKQAVEATVLPSS
jgi:hypothetical protein